MTKRIISAQSSEECIIYYKTSDKKMLNLDENDFDSPIELHTYDEQGIIKFETPIKKLKCAAFLQCNTLESITIPNCVNKISTSAFRGCINLKEINHKFSSTDKYSLIENGTITYYVHKGPKEYVIPENVTKIGQSAFRGSNISKVVIPEGVTIIADCAFQYCENLSKVIMPNSVTQIGQSAFSNCKKLTSIKISDNIRKIGPYAFVGCKMLSEFECLHASLDKKCIVIDGVLAAFAPAGITEYTLPPEVLGYDKDVFAYNRLLKKVRYSNETSNASEVKTSKVTDGLKKTASDNNNCSDDKSFSQKIESFRNYALGESYKLISKLLSEQKEDCQWIKTGNKIKVQGLELIRGNFYLGNFFRVPRIVPNGIKSSGSKNLIWATIHPDLKISQGDYSNRYFNSYYDLTKEGRYIYLSWLANQIVTESIPEDILFLHIWGLQVRLFLDPTTTIEDKDEVVKHLIQIKSELLLTSRVISYIDHILDIVFAAFYFGNSRKFNLSNVYFTQYADKLISSYDSINADNAFDIYKEVMPNRLPKRFNDYFKPYFQKKYKPIKVKNAYFSYDEVFDIPFEFYENSHLNRPKNHLVFCLFERNKQLDSPTSLLSRFDRFVGEFENYYKISEQVTDSYSSLAYFILPTVVQENEKQTFKDFSEKLKSLAPNQENIIDYNTLINLFGIRYNEKGLNKALTDGIMTGLKRVHYGIIPYYQVNKKYINSSESCVLYKYSKGVLDYNDTNFKNTELLCKLIALVLQKTDIGDIDFNMVKAVISKLNDNPHNQSYLNAYVTWLLHKKISFDQGVKKAVLTLNKKQKDFCLQVLLKIIVSGETIKNERVDELNKILPYLYDGNDSIHSLLHHMLTDNSIFVTIEKTDNSTEFRPDNNIVLDSNKLKNFMQQTEISQSLLSDIFKEEDDSSNKTKSKSDENITKEILAILFTKEIWDYKEFQEICNNRGILPGSILEKINDYAYEMVDDIVAEESENKIYITMNYKKDLI